MQDENQPIINQRHSLSHIAVQAIQRVIDSKIQLGIGPWIDNGFYHDFLWSSKPEKTDEEIFKAVNEEMRKIVKEGQEFLYFDMDAKQTQEILGDILQQPYTLELCNDLIEKGEKKLGFYINTINEKAAQKLLEHCSADYRDKYSKATEYFVKHFPEEFENKFVVFANMCKGPHVENSKEIPSDAFCLEKSAGAYWKGDEKNIMMTRFYGLAFSNKEELKEYQAMMEEARKRDHRVLGEKLKLFTISQLVGAGLPLFQPNGMIIRKAIEEYLRELHSTKGYLRVCTPHIAKEDLYNVSGHAKHYLDDMFKVHGGTSKEDFYLKPMNCPHHMQIYADNQFSYRDMPIRYFEPATVYRDEKTGQLSGLTRVRSITQDDGHLFCRVTQIKEEISVIVDIIKKFYETMGMLDGYWVSLSVRGDDKSKYLGGEEVRDIAEKALKDICNELHVNYKTMPGEAAFYGPKLDFMFKDAIGRERQLSTIQVDFNLPERFELSFVNEAGEKERPVVIHRAIGGSLERCMGVVIEHFAGAFPLWLAPTQFQVIPVAEKFNDYAQKLSQKLKDKLLRVKTDDSSDSFSKKIRNAELMKVPYILIVGEKEETDNTVSIRVFKTKEQLTMDVEKFIEEKMVEYKERRL